ncbi:unnamed protein product [Mytilus coruscus]|uniref:Uncharacterized protein n=1 Tax=Mytilus coruscus TaxID=42192 RepID=A0A6J8ADW1_MYTCO|nr:unnamed protein product [Mytilus coruscus]
MANKEIENFYRGSTLIVDNTKTSFGDLLGLQLTLKNFSFEDFINLHQHEIYHLSYGTSRTCCQCTPGLRNTFIGHASAGRISDADYEVHISNIISGIMEIARVCKNEANTKQSLADVCKRPLDETLFIQYQNMLLEQIQKENRLEKKLDDITLEIPDKIEQSIRKTFSSNIPAMVEQSVQTALQKSMNRVQSLPLVMFIKVFATSFYSI